MGFRKGIPKGQYLEVELVSLTVDTQTVVTLEYLTEEMSLVASLVLCWVVHLVVSMGEGMA